MTLKTNQTISCTSLDDARLKADKYSNGVIIVKDNSYHIVNYKTFDQFVSFGYTQVR